jgi:predicted O-methyltransferase YrrM
MSEPELNVLTAFARGKDVLELGAWVGGSTVALGMVANSVVTVDWFKGDPHAGLLRTDGLFEQNVKLYRRFLCPVVAIRMGFDEMLYQTKWDFDLIFLDGFHSEEAVARDLANAAPHLRPGGWLFCHDADRFGVDRGIRRAGKAVRWKVDSLACVS